MKAVVLRTIRFLLDNIPYLRLFLSKALPDPVVVYITEKSMSGRRDRLYLRDTLLRHLASKDDSKIMFVGCRSYTQAYGRLFHDSSSEYWTTDIDPESVTIRIITFNIC